MSRRFDLDRQQREQELRRRRADNYLERRWRDHTIATGRYKGDKVPEAVITAMREARSAHLCRDLAGFDLQGDLCEPVATFPYRGKHRDDTPKVWAVHPCGAVTIDAEYDPNADF
jgi:hypothetical protein